ncbi:hypothetical protein Zmor_022522 [Zophobas morio]|uniref:Peptidase S1 domain-containing protein n=1 Tax=Zophobas morio TaxID=2755281 RepID=A0AA38HWB3_9CUCU|nr:hypothetical protein Zmor_022522 [Zophobas morio]
MNSSSLFTILIAFVCLHQTATNRSENPCIDNYQWRIIGGQTAAPGQFPFVASLRNESNGLWGAASILNENWLVTAAHCVEGYTTANLSVVVGSTRITSGGVHHTLASILQSPSYDPLTAENDIALLQVQDAITFDDSVQPIEIARGANNQSATVLGWGLAQWGYYPDELQFLPTRITPDEECQSYWETLADTQICSVVGEGVGVCCGDSGGPLVADGRLVGVVSYGLPCALGAPDIYTRVAAFEKWIKETIN